MVSTRTYDDRLQTIKNVRAAGISVCCGGILGLGEKDADRVGLLHELVTLAGGHPESVPVNALVAVPGTPIGDGGKAQQVRGGAEVYAAWLRANVCTVSETEVNVQLGQLTLNQHQMELLDARVSGAE